MSGGVATRVELDALERCEDCGGYHAENYRQLTPRCHPQVGFVVVYERAVGVLHFHCVKCEMEVARILVAETPPAGSLH
jgi:hypothetical protein